MRVYCQALGCDGFGSRAILLFFDEKRFLFNVPEGTQRYCTEAKTKMMKVQGLFLTRVHPEEMLGLPGMLLTLREQERTKNAEDGMKSITGAMKAGGVHHATRAEKDAVTVSGPSPLKKLIKTCEPFMRCPGFYKLHEFAFEPAPSIVYTSDTTPQYTISGINIDGCVSYRLDIAEQPGKFLPNKANELGVKGRKRAWLKNGETVESDTIPGRMVQPHEVLDAPIPPVRVFVIASPMSDKIRNFCKPEEGVEVKGVYHVSHVIQDETYKAGFSFITAPQFFSSVSQHTVFYSSALQHDRLHAVSPYLFPAEDLDWTATRPVLTVGPPMKQLETLNVTSGQATEQGSSKDARAGLQLEEGRSNWPPELKETLKNEASTEIVPEYPSLTLLGTGGMMPSKYRNVTSMLIETSRGRYVILDSGEGTLGQIRRVRNVDAVLGGLDMIWISHIHADHHVGLATLLQRRAQVHHGISPVQVIGPIELQEYLEVFQEAVELNYLYKVCSDNEETIGEGVKVRSIPVEHCSDAWGCVVTGNDPKWKIVYSGDTRPCEKVVEAGEGCDMLVHEATFEDEKSEDAVSKCHSTVSEAFSVGERMQAKLTVLTHFSQRYPKTPPPTPGGITAALGFDLMTITPSCGKRLLEMNVRLRILEDYYAKIDEDKKRMNHEIIEAREKKIKEDRLAKQQKRLQQEAEAAKNKKANPKKKRKTEQGQ
eukprot:TRINITY_DN14695_c0_g1_i1.p1 TRINITY_DN14695_c0_g1~~TRINITY_DN14695_c0_g1_i1.p1  ORF type:complete len:722 (+),score=113.56 TRINITY_DN14695_c0_g1_i1:41-2167(+)